MNITKPRAMALLSAAAIAAATMLQPAPAQAATSNNYKAGAAILGAAGILLATKGETLPAVLAGAGAIYAYNKSVSARHSEEAASKYPYGYPYYGAYPNNGAYPYGYPTATYPNGTYPAGTYPGAVYPTGTYPTATYPGTVYPNNTYPGTVYPRSTYGNGGYASNGGFNRRR